MSPTQGRLAQCPPFVLAGLGLVQRRVSECQQLVGALIVLPLSDPDRAPHRLRHGLLQAVAEMDSEQLRSLEGSDALRQQLSREAIEIWGEEVVRRVVLTELLVQ